MKMSMIEKLEWKETERLKETSNSLNSIQYLYIKHKGHHQQHQQQTPKEWQTLKDSWSSKAAKTHRISFERRKQNE